MGARNRCMSSYRVLLCLVSSCPRGKALWVRANTQKCLAKERHAAELVLSGHKYIQDPVRVSAQGDCLNLVHAKGLYIVKHDPLISNLRYIP